MLSYRCAPACSRVPRAWRTSLAASAGPAGARPASGSPPPQPHGGAAHEAGPVCARRKRAASAPISFLYHSAVKALLPLI